MKLSCIRRKTICAKGLDAFLELRKTGASYTVAYKLDAWQAAIDGKGLNTIASSEDLELARVNHLYHLRDASEKQYMIMKLQLSFDVIRVHSDTSLMARFAECFVAAILRAEIMIACHKQELDTNHMLREIDRISLVLVLTARSSCWKRFMFLQIILSLLLLI